MRARSSALHSRRGEGSCASQTRRRRFCCRRLSCAVVAAEPVLVLVLVLVMPVHHKRCRCQMARTAHIVRG